MNQRQTYIIAEAGVNHNGNREWAFKLVDAAVEAGADAVKFQTFVARNLVTKSAPKAEYQVRNMAGSKSQLEMLTELELDHQTHLDLVAYCEKKKIDFLSTAFDFESLKFLTEGLGLKRLKIASGELTNSPFLYEHARSGADLIVSTGMANLGEIEKALGVISFGYTSSESPSIDGFYRALASKEGQRKLKEKVILLHCTTEYPAPLEEINLRAMGTLSSSFQLPIGYSDHSDGITVPIAAVAMGANLIEKHFTLDKTLPGPDHKASLEPSELRQMVAAIRATELCLGSSLKSPTVSEVKNRAIARKSIVAASDIKKGEPFTKENLAFKRPGTGMQPEKFWDLLGKVSGRDWVEGELIRD
jgi:N-acetylneuraminate synthase